MFRVKPNQVKIFNDDKQESKITRSEMKGLIVYTLLKIKIHHKWQSSAMRILVRQIVK